MNYFTMKSVIYLYICSISFILCCMSCRQRAEINYSNSIVPEKTISLTGETIDTDFLFGWPRDIFVMDSVLIIHDSQTGEYSFHIFDKATGKHLTDFGRRGRGPGEVLNVASVNCIGDTLVVYDTGIKQIKEYKISELLSGRNGCVFECSIAGTAENLVMQILPAGNGNYILSGNDCRMRFGLWDRKDNRMVCKNTFYPNYEKDDEINWSISNYAAQARYNHSNHKLVAATYIGGVLEICDVMDSKIENSSIKYFYDYKDYRIAQGAVPKWVTLADKTQIGFQYIALTGNYIFGLVWGSRSMDIEKSSPDIFRFDYRGKPIAKYILGDRVITFSVDNDNCFYGMSYDEDGEWRLKKYTY